MSSYNRYTALRSLGGTQPFVKIIQQPTDIFLEYTPIVSRLDKLSQTYYGTPLYWWMILMANPQYSLEFDIEEGDVIRIPFPFQTAYDNYITQIDLIKKI
jgi:hypothetical protein